MAPGGQTFQGFSRFALLTKPYPPLWDLAGANAVGRRERASRPIPWRAAGAPGPHGLGRHDERCVPSATATAPTRPDVSGSVPKAAMAHLRHRSSGCPRVRAPSSARPSLGQGVFPYIPIGILSSTAYASEFRRCRSTAPVAASTPRQQAANLPWSFRGRPKAGAQNPKPMHFRMFKSGHGFRARRLAASRNDEGEFFSSLLRRVLINAGARRMSAFGA